MPQDFLFNRLCDNSTINIGWHLAHADSRDDFATDPLGYADYAFMKKERLGFVIEQLRNHRYRVGRLTDIDVPKSGLSVRPGNVLPIEESTVLHAIVYLIAPRIDSRLREGVYSYRLAKDWPRRAKRAESLFSHAEADNIPFLKRKTIRSISIDEPWYDAWPEFDSASARAVKEEGYTHLTKTDITAYFENIELALLGSMLRKWLPSEPTIVEILLRILDQWTRRTPSGIPVGRGIPQGNDVSSFLGNAYLSVLDEELAAFANQKEAKWFRYVDDIKVFTKSYEDAREAVFLINKALRRLHLNLQGSKTSILTGADLLREVDDRDLQTINGLIELTQKAIASKNKRQITQIIRRSRPITKSFTQKKTSGVINLSGSQSRLFRRCLTLFGMAARPHLKKAAFTALRHLPDVRIMKSSLTYLRRLDTKLHDKISLDLLAILQKRELPFPYQAATAIETFKFLSPDKSRGLASAIRKLSAGKKTHWYVRQKSLETILVLPYSEKSAQRFSETALADEHPWVRRAGASLIVRGHVEWVRQQVDQLVYHADPDVSRVGLFWKRHLDDHSVAEKAASALLKSSDDPYSFTQRLPMLYLLSCSEDENIAKKILTYVTLMGRSKHSIVRWHCEGIKKRLEKWLKKA